MPTERAGRRATEGPDAQDNTGIDHKDLFQAEAREMRKQGTKRQEDGSRQNTLATNQNDPRLIDILPDHHYRE
jgi:hypothetical protein